VSVDVRLRPLPPGWATDLAVLELSGSTVEQSPDHLVVRTPDNPGYHWGHVVFVTDPDAVGDAGRWTAVFRAAFPAADWLAVGLVRRPDDDRAWRALGLEVEVDEVLTTSTVPATPPRPEGCTVRRLEGQDWAASVTRALAGDEGAGDRAAYEAFVRRRSATRQDLVRSGAAAFFGAFVDGRLVSELGVVRCGSTARYQSVSTDPAHRRQGLAAHLLGVAGQWAAERGCRRWVIVTEATNPAGRVYRRAGFAPDVGNAQVYRGPAR
jgi:GNAT superfamily N-acetyltransferase